MTTVVDGSGRSRYDILIQHIVCIHDLLESEDEIILVGDFNLPNVQWLLNDEGDNYLPHNLTMKQSQFLDTLASLGLCQMSSVVNGMGRQLDLAFSTDSVSTSVEPSLLLLSNLDQLHPALLISFRCFSEACINYLEHEYHFNFRAADYEALSDHLANVDFNACLCGDDIDENVSGFYAVLYEAFAQFVPYVRARGRDSAPPWFNSELRSLRNRRNRLWKRYIRVDSEDSRQDFIACHEHFISLSRSLYEEYLHDVSDSLFSDPRAFFRFVNLKRKVDNYPSTMEFSGISSNDSNIICNSFAAFFRDAFDSSNFQPNGNNFSHMNNLNLPLVPIPVVTEEILLQHIGELPTDFTCGPDGVPAAVLKKCSSALIYPLQLLFRKSLAQSHFPAFWKTSFLIPIFKSGRRREVSNYRPIAKLSCIPKLFELMVQSQLSSVCSGLVSSRQHGFLRGRSTVSNLLEFVSCSINGFLTGCQTDCIYTDFSKAFDKLSHSIIIFKLAKLGFPACLISWIQSYLSDRTYRVRFRGTLSDAFMAPSGVPQGSHLGPMLFILSVDDITYLLRRCKILIYADDIKIFLPIKSSVDCVILQSELNLFYNWCGSNNLKLNIGKCQVMTFSRSHNNLSFPYQFDSTSIMRAVGVRDLGVHLDMQLNFINHINNIAAKANSILAFVFRWSKEFPSPHIRLHLYTSLVRPLLEYASQVWSPYYGSHIKRIESVQRRFVRSALRRFPWSDPLSLPPYEERLGLLQLATLEKRRRVADIIFLHQLLQGKLDCTELISKISPRELSYSLRNRPPFQVNFARTNYGMFEPLNRMCRFANDVGDLFNINYNKEALKRRLYNS